VLRAPARRLDLGPHLRPGEVLSALDLVHNAALAVAAVGEVLRPRGLAADHRPLAAIGLRPDVTQRTSGLV
jgi:hypothetical protein